MPVDLVRLCVLVSSWHKPVFPQPSRLAQSFCCARGQSIIYNAGMLKRQIGVEVMIEDHFWNDAHNRYVYSFHCPGCAELRLTPELGIYRCDCGSWLIVTNQR
jgi:hypothetical protein